MSSSSTSEFSITLTVSVTGDSICSADRDSILSTLVRSLSALLPSDTAADKGITPGVSGVISTKQTPQQVEPQDSRGKVPGDLRLEIGKPVLADDNNKRPTFLTANIMDEGKLVELPVYEFPSIDNGSEDENVPFIYAFKGGRVQLSSDFENIHPALVWSERDFNWDMPNSWTVDIKEFLAFLDDGSLILEVGNPSID